MSLRRDHQFFLGLRAEAFVARHSVRTWLLVLLPALAVGLRLGLVKLTQVGASARGAMMGDEAGAPVNAYGFLVDGLLTGFTLLYLVFIAMAAFSFASDRDAGVIRHLVTRSLSRGALVAAKFVWLLGLALVATLLLCGTAWLLTGALWDFGPVVEDGFELIGVADIHDEIALGVRLALLPLPAAIGLGVLISVVARSATQAVTLALGAALALDIFKTVLGSSAHFVYATFQPSLLDRSYLSEVARIVRGYSDVLVDERVIQLNTWLPMPQAFLFLLIALFWIRQKQL